MERAFAIFSSGRVLQPVKTDVTSCCFCANCSGFSRGDTVRSFPFCERTPDCKRDCGCLPKRSMRLFAPWGWERSAVTTSTSTLCARRNCVALSSNLAAARADRMIEQPSLSQSLCHSGTDARRSSGNQSCRIRIIKRTVHIRFLFRGVGVINC
jgi:hypothetical protein